MPRIAPLTPPYEPEVDAWLQRWMPPGAAVEPLLLFRTLAVNPELFQSMHPLGRQLLSRGLLPARDREIVIHRMSAIAGAEYEWGVHAVAFGRPVGLTDAVLAATARGGADDPAFTPRDALLVRLCDELHAGARVNDALWAELAAVWNDQELLELIVLASFYRLIAGVINSCGVELEAWAERFPEEAAA